MCKCNYACVRIPIATNFGHVIFPWEKRREKCVTFRYHHQIPNSISRPCVIISAGRVRVEKELSSPYHDLSKSWLDYRNENCIYAHEYKLGLMRDTWLATPHRLFQSFSLSLYVFSFLSSYSLSRVKNSPRIRKWGGRDMAVMTSSLAR